MLVKEYVDTDYGMYAGLRKAWLLTRRNTAEDRRRALGIYLDLAHKAKDVKVVEEASYFAAQVSLLDGRHEESANLFLALRTKFPNSPRVTESALPAAWANYHAGRYKEGSELLDRLIGHAQHPDREEILYVKANCLRQLEQRADAVAMYTRQLTEFPKASWHRRPSMNGSQRFTVTANTKRFWTLLRRLSRRFRSMPTISTG